MRCWAGVVQKTLLNVILLFFFHVNLNTQLKKKIPMGNLDRKSVVLNTP